jgi:hypothetical protein
LSATGATSDAWLAALRASYVPDRSGDVLFVPARGWVLSEHGTNHGTPYEYDTRVPLAFIGAGIEGGRYEAASQIIDVAPTLAALAGIRMPRAQGRVLTEALRTGR